MSRKAAQISPEDLWTLFQQKMRQQNDGRDFPTHYSISDIDKIGQDIKKVNFDFENCEFEHQHEFGIWEGMLGYRLLYPLSYIGVMAGGDWEYPVYFIIYLDQNGKTLRGYVPKNGNVWNHNTHSAFGNNEEEDGEFLKKWIKRNKPAIVAGYGAGFDANFTCDSEDAEIMFSKEAIRQDILGRIEVVEKK